MMAENLRGRGDKRDQSGQLSTERLDARFVDEKEKISLSLLGKTRPVKVSLAGTVLISGFRFRLTRCHLGHC